MNKHYPFVNPPLPYSYQALEPYIDEKTMELHHDKHLQTYVDNLNHILEPYPTLQGLSLEELLSCPLCFPSGLQIPIKNNAGGVYNHIFYFSNLTPAPNLPVPDALSDAITASFGSFDAMKDNLKKAALSVFGSGYVWLILDKNKTLALMVTANQDTPLSSGFCPVLNLDVWEHAYYLKHYNMRKNYIDDWFSVIDWNQVNQNYISCIKKIP